MLFRSPAEVVGGVIVGVSSNTEGDVEAGGGGVGALRVEGQDQARGWEPGQGIWEGVVARGGVLKYGLSFPIGYGLPLGVA